jgi:hypothetical protein
MQGQYSTMQRPQRRDWKLYTKGRAAHIAGNLDAANFANPATEALLQRAGKSRLAEEEGRGSGEEGRKLHFGNGQGVLSKYFEELELEMIMARQRRKGYL